MNKPASQFYEFGPFRLDAVKRVLLRSGEPMPLMPKAFDTLLLLVQNSGRVLEKDELMKQIWPETVVEENNLAVNVSMLRKALGESPTDHRYIVTIPGRGYRFIATVREFDDESSQILVEEHTRSSLVIEQQSLPTTNDETEKKTADALRGQPKRSERWVIVLAAFVAVIVLGLASYVWFTNKRMGPEPGRAVRTIAVLPFRVMSSGLSDDYIGLGMADALITKLSNIRRIVVRPTSSVAKYTTLGQDPVGVGRELQVDSVLDGGIQSLGDRIRITVQLVRVEDGRPLWADTFDEKYTDLFAVQDSISERVTAALAIQLSGEEKDRLTKRYTENIEAYQLYQKGRYFWNKFTEEGLQKSIEYFNQSIEKDGRYALAYAGLAGAYIVLGNNYQDPRESYKKSKAASARALELDDSLVEVHEVLAATRLFYDWDWPAAERELKRGLDLNPNYASVHQLYCYYLRDMGRLDEAIAEAKRALELDPLSQIINTDLARTYFYARQYDRAIEQLRKTLEMEPNSFPAHQGLVVGYTLTEKYPEAIAEANLLISRFGRDQTCLFFLGWAYAKSGEPGEARKLVKELKGSGKSYVFPAFAAIIHAALGETDAAFALLDQAYEAKDPTLIDLKVDPMFDPLRSDQRFAMLLRRMGLPE